MGLGCFNWMGDLARFEDALQVPKKNGKKERSNALFSAFQRVLWAALN